MVRWILTSGHTVAPVIDTSVEAPQRSSLPAAMSSSDSGGLPGPLAPPSWSS